LTHIKQQKFFLSRQGPLASVHKFSQRAFSTSNKILHKINSNRLNNASIRDMFAIVDEAHAGP